MCVLGHRTFSERQKDNPEVVLAPHPRRINRPLPTLPMRAAVGVVIAKPISFLWVETSFSGRGPILIWNQQHAFLSHAYALERRRKMCLSARTIGEPGNSRPRISPMSSLSFPSKLPWFESRKKTKHRNKFGSSSCLELVRPEGQTTRVFLQISQHM